MYRIEIKKSALKELSQISPPYNKKIVEATKKKEFTIDFKRIITLHNPSAEELIIEIKDFPFTWREFLKHFLHRKIFSSSSSREDMNGCPSQNFVATDSSAHGLRDRSDYPAEDLCVCFWWRSKSV